jgi:hypothetical protein
MLLEALAVAALTLAAAGGTSPRSAARIVGRAAGRAAGSLRRVRAEVERLQARASTLGGSSLARERDDLASKVAQLRTIQSEAAQLLSFRPGMTR